LAIALPPSSGETMRQIESIVTVSPKTSPTRSCIVASHRIASHRIASRRIASHRITSHRMLSRVALFAVQQQCMNSLAEPEGRRASRQISADKCIRT
jgi:hypothetical protein